MDVVKDEMKAKRNLDKVMDGAGKWDDEYFNPADADRYTTIHIVCSELSRNLSIAFLFYLHQTIWD